MKLATAGALILFASIQGCASHADEDRSNTEATSQAIDGSLELIRARAIKNAYVSAEIGQIELLPSAQWPAHVKRAVQDWLNLDTYDDPNAADAEVETVVGAFATPVGRIYVLEVDYILRFPDGLVRHNIRVNFFSETRAEPAFGYAHDIQGAAYPPLRYVVDINGTRIVL